MYTFKKRVVIHRSGVPDSVKYCLVLLDDGSMQRAFYNDEWVFCEEYLPVMEKVKEWCYIEDLFEVPKNTDIRMYIDENENCI